MNYTTAKRKVATRKSKKSLKTKSRSYMVKNQRTGVSHAYRKIAEKNYYNSHVKPLRKNRVKRKR
jgi:hypothetical protein